MWDGDSLVLSKPNSLSIVPSPPCGMVTVLLKVPKVVFVFLVPSPPCGMVTNSVASFPSISKRLVPSPPCGMVTSYSKLEHHEGVPFRAHRVGWKLISHQVSIEVFFTFVPSPPCGMETPIPKQSLTKGDQFRAHRVGW